MTTKLVVALAIVVPGGFVIFAAAVAAHAMWKRRQSQMAAAQ